MCIFCSIVKGDIPARIIYEDEKFLAFMDAFPRAVGHTLIIPKEHFETFDELPKELACEMMEVIYKVVKQLKNLKMDGFNILNNNKKVSGQEVPHVHFHIIPRYENEGYPVYVLKDPINVDLDSIYDRIME
ncbi:histidine triad (HIT) protein [Methanococcus vannielii SB]|jgi:histidine triad (HIT) family protein|uniref:Histidine triad (HIT) protein n=1 Tax=Methanococcus vannielii (strain ATCC 35089 / DSM 1224 / JCM 13029 / OCM 148 / SB) TaxID=406327 RepID=A6URW7_METVS|nr:HIT family protein [Methanococcus vannielii]ABR55239.1 histidine triad (HIT) protein [Methanococcus vannielii SB]